MWAYLKSKEFWLTIAGLIVLFFVFFFGFFEVFLPMYTQNGKQVVVPKVKDFELETSIAKIDSAGLNYVIVDSLYVPNLSPNAVIAQDPSSMSRVKPGRKIYLTVNKRKPPMVRMPDILNVSNYQAKLRLESWNLTINKITFIPHEYRNLVLKAKYKGNYINPGDSLPVGSRIDLIVGKGKGTQRVEIPDLVGLSYQEAISIMHGLGLNIGAAGFDDASDEEDGTVITQSPRYLRGDSVNLGQEINLIISGPEPDVSIEGILLELEEDSEGGEEKPPISDDEGILDGIGN